MESTRNWKAGLIGAAIVVGAAALGALAMVYSGVVNVAASDQDSGFSDWLLTTTMERSVRTRAASVGEPIAVDSALLVHGFEHYDEMCVVCHAAPGKERGEYGRGLSPEPPELAEEAHEWTDRELFWITRHGVKMTGMPAFGPTHTDEEIWAIVAAVRRLEDMSAEEYEAMVAAAARGHDADSADDHTHAPGTPPHEH